MYSSQRFELDDDDDDDDDAGGISDIEFSAHDTVTSLPVKRF